MSFIERFIIYLTASIILCLYLKAVAKGRLKTLKNDLLRQKEKCDQLSQDYKTQEEKNSALEITSREIFELFDLTKDICKILDKEGLFKYFNEKAGKYLKETSYKFLEPESDLAPYDGWTYLNLELENNLVGYLVVDKIAESDKDKFHILSQQFTLALKRALLYQKVQEMAITDSLTGVFGRRYFLERAEEELQRSKKFGLIFSFLIIDVDNFKKHNDHFGHLVGDVILKKVAQAIKENTRQIDLAGRYGGDEFVLLLSETEKREAGFAAERILQAVAKEPVAAYDEKVKVTVSIGMASFPEEAQSFSQLVKKADEALYRAKKAGRNRASL